MAEVTATTFNDDNHWSVDLRGTINGEASTKSYHLAAESMTQARVNALRKFSTEWDDVPLVARAERYRTWRAHEPRPEGELGLA